MIILSRKEDIYNIAVSISIFIKETQVIKTKFSDEIENIINTLKKFNKQEYILDAVEKLKSCEINIDILADDNNNKENYLNIFLKLKDHSDSIPLLLKTKAEDCRNFQEVVGEMDDKFLNTNDIIDFEKCVELMNKLGNVDTIKTKKDIDVISSFVKEIKENKGIELYFIKYFNNYVEIKNLYDSKLDKSEASRKIIEFICQSSKFILTNINNKFFNGNYFDSKELEVKNIVMEELLQLRDREKKKKNVIGESNQIYCINYIHLGIQKT